MNLYYDDTTGTCGIIDWDGLSSGLPPLFDLFRYFISIRLIYDTKRQDIFISFIETYFTENMFSTFVKEAFCKYCQHFDLDKKHIYQYLMDSLLFLYNHYLLMFPPNRFVDLYQRMLCYSLKNQQKFVLNIG